MDILLFGGAFDPVHTGHYNILKAALEYRKFDKVIIMPTGTPGHKNSCHAPFAVRKLFCKKAFGDLHKNLEISSFEGESFSKSYSYLTINHLHEEYPESKIWFLIGADSAITMQTWRNREYLQRNTVFIVFPREIGQDEELKAAVKKIQEFSPETVLLEKAPLPISSTQIRNRISESDVKNIREYLKKDVRNIIRKYHIYDDNFYKRNIGTAELLVNLLLRKKRATHTVNVAVLAKSLAKKHGVDQDKAYLAGLLHDIQKQVSPEMLIYRAKQENAIINDTDKPLSVLHGYAAADYMKKELGIEDEELIMAVSNHTCGRPGMSNLEKIIYLADMTSKERDYPEKDEIYKLEWQNLDLAMETALKYSINWITEKGRDIDNNSLRAYEYFKKLNEKFE